MPSKALDYYLSLPYTIELTRGEDGYWFTSIPLVKGCMTQGESRVEALEMLDEAMSLWLETALAEDIRIPEPTGGIDRYACRVASDRCDTRLGDTCRIGYDSCDTPSFCCTHV